LRQINKSRAAWTSFFLNIQDINTMVAQSNIRWFSDTRLNDVTLVGGKNASLGELYSVLSGQGIRVPNGFALTAQAYRDALTAAGAWDKLHQLLDGLDKTRVDVL
jgi:pyruvate, water dikinase